MSIAEGKSLSEPMVVQFKPYRRSWFKSAWDGQARPLNDVTLGQTLHTCDECWGPLRYGDFETYCSVCGLIHRRQMFWEVSLEIEAGRRQFDHDSEEGSGTLQNRHTAVIEDSAAATSFDGNQLSFGVYPLDQYNDGRDGHRGEKDDTQKLNRHRRFLEQRAEALATQAGLSGEQVQEVIRIVTSINSGAFTFYGPNREGGGQDAHIVAAIAYIGNRHHPNHPDLIDFIERMESRDEFKTVMTDIGMDREDVRGAVSQLRKQLSGERG